MKSLFDGWTKQIKGSLHDGQGGFCAIGWLRLGSDEAIGWTQADPTIDRVGSWILINMAVPAPCSSGPATAIVWANNNGMLDPDGFRMVDLLTQGYVPEVDTLPTDAVEIPMAL